MVSPTHVKFVSDPVKHPVAAHGSSVGVSAGPSVGVSVGVVGVGVGEIVGSSVGEGDGTKVGASVQLEEAHNWQFSVEMKSLQQRSHVLHVSFWQSYLGVGEADGTRVGTPGETATSLTDGSSRKSLLRVELGVWNN